MISQGHIGDDSFQGVSVHTEIWKIGGRELLLAAPGCSWLLLAGSGCSGLLLALLLAFLALLLALLLAAPACSWQL